MHLEQNRLSEKTVEYEIAVLTNPPEFIHMTHWCQYISYNVGLKMCLSTYMYF